MLPSTNNQSVKNKPSSARLMTTAWTLTALWLAVYIVLDMASYEYIEALLPLSQPWTNPVIYTMILIASLFAAGASLLLTRQFEPQEPPRRVWLFFSLGWCCWVLGEIGGFVYRAVFEQKPQLTFMDLCWVTGYTFFAVAFFLQFRLIYGRGRRIGRYHFAAIFAGILALAAVIAFLARLGGFGKDKIWLNLYLIVLYPTCDLVIGAAAVWLSLLFARGRWSRPWWGLIAFFFADGIYSWYGLGGYQILTPAADAWLSLVTDTFYIGGYLIVGLASLSLFVMQRHGAPALESQS